MPRFFTGDVNGDFAHVTGEDAKHMALALRMKRGESVTICDAAGKDYQCVIEAISPDEVRLNICAQTESAGEPRVKITLYQALPKSDKLETIIQKSVELGVSRIVPVLTHRCVSRPDTKTMEKKLERYRKISLEAAKQCGRGRVPDIEPLISFKEAVMRMSKDPISIFFYENAQRSLREALEGQKPECVSILIGSEGGFEVNEASFAVENGLQQLSLGSRILRCETAPLAAITAVMYACGEI